MSRLCAPPVAHDRWAATRQNQQSDCAPSEDSDQPGHPPGLIRVLAVRMKKALIFNYPLSAQRRLWSDRTGAQADLSLRWAHSHFDGFVMSRLRCAQIGYSHTATAKLYDFTGDQSQINGSIFKWATSWENLFCHMRTSAQSDQRLWYSLLR